MIFDCFIFFNELDLLTLRLHELYDTVDKFVIVEATKMHTNKPKPLLFKKHANRYSEFMDKIVHIVVDDFPEYNGNPWLYECYQRNAIVRGLYGCNDDDIIMISDCDEIPRKEVLVATSKRFEQGKLYNLNLDVYYYYLNCLCSKSSWTYGTRVCDFAFLMGGLDSEPYDYGAHRSFEKGNFTTPSKVRLYHGRLLNIVQNGGWHFGWLGGADKIMLKMSSMAHQEFNTRQINNLPHILASLKTLNNHLDGSCTFTAIPIDDSFPNTVARNMEAYSHLILDNSADTGASA